jgi:hypothetical protein
MIKVGDRVFPVHLMGNKGTVIKEEFEKSKQWFVGGVSSMIRFLTVKHDSGDVKKYYVEDLMRFDE